jgi:hypothetical protein
MPHLTVKVYSREPLGMKVNIFANLARSLLLLLVFGVVQANADTVYLVKGTMTVPGNSANPGVSETIDFSFELDYSQMVNFNTTFVGTPTTTSFGPLGSFTAIVNHSASGYIGFFSSAAEIDLLGDFSPFFNPGPVISGQSWLYTCSGSLGTNNIPICAPFVSLDPNFVNVYGTASASVDLVATPEPGTLYLFVLGALALCLMKKTLLR